MVGMALESLVLEETGVEVEVASFDSPAGSLYENFYGGRQICGQELMLRAGVGL